MCGILGLISFKKKISSDKIVSILDSASKLQNFRGPDNRSTWINQKKNIAFHFPLTIFLDQSACFCKIGVTY